MHKKKNNAINKSASNYKNMSAQPRQIETRTSTIEALSPVIDLTQLQADLDARYTNEEVANFHALLSAVTGYDE